MEPTHRESINPASRANSQILHSHKQQYPTSSARSSGNNIIYFIPINDGWKRLLLYLNVHVIYVF